MNNKSVARVVSFLPFLAVTFAHLYGLLPNATGPWVSAIAPVTKPMLMPFLMFGFWQANVKVSSRTWILLSLGLVFSWLGDIFLYNFLLGVAFFFVAQLFYIALFATTGKRRLPGWTVLYVLWFIGLVWVLQPYLGDLLLPLLAYGAALGLMGALAGRMNGWVALGGALFALSDSFLAVNRFHPDWSWAYNGFTVMVTYIFGQALITWGVMKLKK